MVRLKLQPMEKEADGKEDRRRQWIGGAMFVLDGYLQNLPFGRTRDEETDWGIPRTYSNFAPVFFKEIVGLDYDRLGIDPVGQSITSIRSEYGKLSGPTATYSPGNSFYLVQKYTIFPWNVATEGGYRAHDLFRETRQRELTNGVHICARGLMVTEFVDKVPFAYLAVVAKDPIPKPCDPTLKKVIERHRRRKTISKYTDKPKHGDEVIRLYGDRRCLLDGAPNHMALCLLQGLRTPVLVEPVSDQIKTARGNGLRRRRNPVSVPELITAGLMEKVPTRKSTARAKTTLWGLMLLQHWAETRKGFKPYLEAYLPKGLERKMRVEMMLKDPEPEALMPF